MDNNTHNVIGAEMRGPRADCPVCGHPYDDHIRGECPENVKQQLELAYRVLDRYVPKARAAMKISLDIAKLNYLMSLHARGTKEHFVPLEEA